MTSYKIYATKSGDITLDCLDETIFIKNICIDRTICEEYLINSVPGCLPSAVWHLTIELCKELDINILQQIKKNIKECSITLWINDIINNMGCKCNPIAIETYKNLQIEAFPRNKTKTIHIYARDRIPR